MRLAGAGSGTEDFTVSFELVETTAEERYNIYRLGVVRPSRDVDLPWFPPDHLPD